MDQNKHSIFNGRFKQKPSEAKLFLEILDHLVDTYEEYPIDELIHLFWGNTRESLEEIIKKSKKREKKVKAKFAPINLEKPANAYNLYKKAYKQKCDEKKIKYDIKQVSEQYKSLSSSDKESFENEAKRLKNIYNIEYEKQRQLAIDNKLFPEDQPKKPLTSFFRFSKEHREAVTNDLKEAGNYEAKLVVKNITELWKELTPSEKAPYIDAYNSDKQLYDEQMKIWNEKEASRTKNNITQTVFKTKPNLQNLPDINIETNNVDSKPKNTKSKEKKSIST